MSSGRPPPPSPRGPRRRGSWHTRGEVRLGAGALLLVVIAAAAAIVRGGDDAGSEPARPATAAGIEVALAADPTADPEATATVERPAVTPSVAPTAPAVVPPDETVMPTATPTATATPIAEPTPIATPEPAAITVQPQRVGTGETALVVAEPGAAGALATSGRLGFLGGSYTLMDGGDRYWGVFAVPLTAALGPATLTVTLLDGAGEPVATLETAYEVIDLGRAVDYITLTPEQASVLTPEASALEAELRAEQFAQFDREARWAGTFAAPAAGPLTSEFGVGRSFNGGPVSGFHGGTDYGGPEGTPILSAGPGRVSWAGEMPIRGNTVLIDHGGGVKSGYHHLSRIDVAVGDEVQAGTQLGAMGATGLVTGPHLHWEVTIWGVAVDPVTWLAEAFVPPAPVAAEDAASSDDAS